MMNDVKMKLKDFFKPHSVSCSKAKDIFEEGLDYEKAGNMEEAYSCYKIAADAGMPEAMFRLFVLFAVKGFQAKEENNLFDLAFKGTPVLPWSIKTSMSPDEKTGMYWLIRAAEIGHIQACGTYGRILCDAGDLESGLTYLHKASDAGDCDAFRWITYFTKYDAVSDEEYDAQISKIITEDNCINLQSAGILKDGRPSQLARYGYKLMSLFNRGQIDSAVFGQFMPYCDEIPYFPVAPKRGMWQTFVRINKDALPDGTLLSFTSDICVEPRSLHGLRMVGEAVYESPSFGWLGKEKKACVMKVDGSVLLDEKSVEDVAKRYRLREDEFRPENVAFFEEDGEKEYSVEIAEIRDNKVNVLYRYTIGGSDDVKSYFEPKLLTLRIDETRDDKR